MEKPLAHVGKVHQEPEIAPGGLGAVTAGNPFIGNR